MRHSVSMLPPLHRRGRRPAKKCPSQTTGWFSVSPQICSASQMPRCFLEIDPENWRARVFYGSLYPAVDEWFVFFFARYIYIYIFFLFFWGDTSKYSGFWRSKISGQEKKSIRQRLGWGPQNTCAKICVSKKRRATGHFDFGSENTCNLRS